MIPKINPVELKSFVKASMDLTDTPNKQLADSLKMKMKMPDLASSMQERIDSYVLSKSPLTRVEPAKADEIIAENSINFIA